MAHDNTLQHRSFRGANGDTEHFITITAPGDRDFAAQIAFIDARYQEVLNGLKLDDASAIFRRVFLSDAINQTAQLRKQAKFVQQGQSPVSISIVQQPPLPYSKIALFAYHIESAKPFTKSVWYNKHMIVEKNGTRHVWSTQLCLGACAASAPEEVHTQEIFNNLIDMLGRHGANLKDHCVRTWLYLKDVDVFYRGMVTSRRNLFMEHGLNEHTHYISSTGIEGCCDHQYDRVLMDAYSILDLKKEQLSFLNDFERLCPTKDYQVTFERGTRIGFADRAHHYISGTASIDKYGHTVHLGDVMRQLALALENIDALLVSGKARITDMMIMIVYLRDAADYDAVSAVLRARFPTIPTVIVEGAVCRPEWLIEIEGIAATPDNAPHLPSF